MKVKLLRPIPGYEDVAELRKINLGEHYIGSDGRPAVAEYNTGTWLAITPKPLPTIHPPKWLGMVGHTTRGFGFVTRVDPSGGVVVVFNCGSSMWIPAEQLTLVRTANIETSPELEALFKDG